MTGLVGGGGVVSMVKGIRARGEGHRFILEKRIARSQAVQDPRLTHMDYWE